MQKQRVQKRKSRDFLKTKKKEVVDYFPRGGGSEKGGDFTFNTAMIDRAEMKAPKFLKKKRQVDRDTKHVNEDEELEGGVTATTFDKEEGATSKALLPKFKVGDLVLLTISEIRKDYMIANYTRNKKAMIHTNYSGLNADNSEDFSFVNHFTVGQFVCGAVVSPGNDIQLASGYMNKKILVSIDPKIVNTGLRANNLVEGMDLYGKLIRDEETGLYSADFGFTNVEDEIEKFNEKGRKKKGKYDFEGDDEEEEDFDQEVFNDDEDNQDLSEEEFDIEKYTKKNKKRKIEQINTEYEVVLIDNEESPEIFNEKLTNSHYFFKLTKVEKTKDKTILTVSLNYSKYKFPVKKCDFKFLRPGFLFKANETRELVNGIEVAFGGNIGSIFGDHMKSNSKGKNIMTRIIHVSVNKVAVSLSSKRSIVNLHVDDVEGKRAIVGKIFESAKVEDVLFGNAYQVNIDKFSAFLHSSQVDNRDTQKYEKDDLIPKVMVKEYNYFDDRPMLTAKKEALTSELTTWENIHVGKFVKGLIEEIRNDGLIIKLNSFIEGRIPKEHLTDYPLTKIPKKYKHGQSITCRIFAYDYKTKYLILTTKESLIDEKVTLTGDYTQIKEGEDINVVYIGNGLFQHSGEIIGKLLNFNKLKSKENFKVGKLYAYKVYKIVQGKKGGKPKLFLTNETEVWQPGVGDYESVLKRNPLLSTISAVLNFNIEEGENSKIENLTPGSILDFTIITSKKLVKLLIKHGVEASTIQDNIDTITKNFLIARHEESNTYGFIPQELVSDFYQEKIIQILSKVKTNPLKMLILYTNLESRVLFLTPKKSLIQNVNDVPSTKSNLINDHIYYGYVSKKAKNGFVLQFLEGEKSLVKSKLSSATVINPGQTIIAKYKSDGEKKKFDCANVFTQSVRSIEDLKDEAMEYINNYLNDLNIIVENKNTLHNIKINSTIEGKIGIIKEYGLLVSLKLPGNANMATAGITGFLKNEHMKGEYQVGDTRKFRVIDLDYLDNIVYLTDDFEEEKEESNTQSHDFYNRNKSKEKVLNFTIELFHDNYISLCLESDNKVKAIMPCNLYNFNYEASQLSDMFKIGDTLSSKLTGYSTHLEKIILEPPAKLLEKLQKSSLVKDMHKNIIAPGNVIKGRINGIKGAHVYVYIDKNTLGRIHLNDFVGNLEDIKVKLNQWHSATEGDNSNSLNRVASEVFPEELKVKCRILHVEQKKDMKVCDLITVSDDSPMVDLIFLEKAPLDLSGVKPNVGIISRIDIFNKYPIKIDFNSSVTNSSNANKVQIHFSYIPVDKISSLRSAYKVGEKITFYSRQEKDSDTYIHSLSPFDNKTKKDFQFELEKVYPVRILKSIPGRGLVVDLSFFNNHTEAFVDICEISDDLHPNPLNLHKSGVITTGRILSFDSKSNKFFLSLRNSIVEQEFFDVLKNGSTLKFNKKFESFEKIADYRNKIFKYGAKQVIEQNLVAIGYVTSSSEKGVFIKIASDVIVRASLRELTDEKTTKPYLLFKQDSLVLCRVVSIYNPEGKNKDKNTEAESNKLNINVSLRESVVKHNLTLRTKDLVPNNFYLCTLMNESEADKKFEVCIMGSTFTGLLKKKHIKDKTHSLIKKAMEKREPVLLQLVKLDKNVHPPKLRFSNMNVENVDQSIVINALSKEEEAKNKIYSELYQNVKELNEKYEKDEISYELKELEKNADKIDYESLLNKGRQVHEDDEEVDQSEEEINVEEEEEGDLSENEDAEELILDHNVKSQFLKGLGISLDENPEEGDQNMEVEEENFEGEIEDEDEEEINPNKNLKSSKKREKEHLKEELIIRQREAESGQTSKMEDKQSVEYYEKQILSDPNNSLFWIQYGAYILDKLNLNAARKIFERAITTINIASIKEKMNVWIAYMNLENSYGTQDTFKSVVERALEVNDKKTIYKHLISIYKLSGKYDLAYEVYKIITKNFFSDFNIWKNYLEFLFEMENLKNTSTDHHLKHKFSSLFVEPKEGLHRALQVLGKNKHVEMLVAYGQLQYKFNFVEEARTTFESVLKNYPKRSDIWIVYIDKEIKHTQNVEKIRSIFEKMLNVDLKIKILKTVIKKYLEFEKDFGNAKSLEHVKNLTQKLIMEKMSNLQEDEENQMEVDS